MNEGGEKEQDSNKKEASNPSSNSDKIQDNKAALDGDRSDEDDDDDRSFSLSSANLDNASSVNQLSARQ